MMTTESRWATGTYEMFLDQDEERRPGDLLVTLFARPINLDIREDDDDAPVLSQIEVPLEEYAAPLRSWQRGLHDIGEDALLTPEALESIYGPGLALRILEALVVAARQDSQGLDGAGRPWRTPSAAALPIMGRASEVLEVLKGRFMS